MALNDPLDITTKNIFSLEKNLISYLPKKDYKAEEYKEHHFKKGCLFYWD